MKKMFKITVEWMGETRKAIVAESYDEAMGVIDYGTHVPGDFMNEDDSFRATYVEEIKKAG